jgi:hypothetical protein
MIKCDLPLLLGPFELVRRSPQAHELWWVVTHRAL